MAKGLPNGFQIQYNKPTTSETGVYMAPDGTRSIFLSPVITGTNPQLHRRHHSEPLMALPFDERQLYLTKDLKRPSMRTFSRKCISVCVPIIEKHYKRSIRPMVLKDILDIHSIGPVQKSIFGQSIENMKFFCQLKSHEYTYINDKVLADKAVINAISVAARKACTNQTTTDDEESRLAEEMHIQQKNAKHILMVMSANIKIWVYKFIGWFTLRTVSSFATSIVVNPSQLDAVRVAEQSGLPIIYLPLHRSHMDYILLGLVLMVHDIKLPLVAAGENLKVFFFKTLLNRLGAFYIKRQIDKKNDQLYWSILSSYMKNSMKNGHHLELFLEGARTRSGNCCVPKSGLLSIIVDAYREGIIEDAWIIPVSINYERILEGNFVREQLGQPKKKETFFTAISTFIKAIYSRYGIMRIDFNTPYRLRDLYESVDKKIKLENDKLRKQGMLVWSKKDVYRKTVDGMAKHIVYDCWKSTPIMSTNLVCFLLLKKYRNGTTLYRLALDILSMSAMFSIHNRNIGFNVDNTDVVEHALSLLSPELFVREIKGEHCIVKPNLSVPSLIELSYYGNGLLSHYLHQSIVAIALSKLVGPEFWEQTISKIIISRNELVNYVSFLISILEFDFVCIRPCDTLINIVNTVMEHFKQDGIVFVNMVDIDNQSEEISRNYKLSGNHDQPPKDFVYCIVATEISLNKIKFYRSIMMPYIECMSECAQSFLDIKTNLVPEHEHIQTILKQMYENLDKGTLSYGESISVNTIKHSFLVLEKYEYLQIITNDTTNDKMLAISHEKWNVESMRAFYDDIYSFVEKNY